MTVIYQSPTTGKELKLVHKQFFNLFDLVNKVKVFDPIDQTPEALRYHDICVGVLNTGDVFIGESCPANHEDYSREMALDLSEKDMMNQVYASRAFIIKTERSEYDPLPEAVYLENNGTFTCIGPLNTKLFFVEINEHLELDFKIPKTIISVLVHPQNFTVIGYNQEVKYRKNYSCDSLALLNAHLKYCKLADQYRRYASLD